MKSHQKFEVGDKVKVVLCSGSIQEGIVKAVLVTTAGVQLNVAFGEYLAASVNAREVVEKLPPAIETWVGRS
jgi:hypothetical protein